MTIFICGIVAMVVGLIVCWIAYNYSSGSENSCMSLGCTVLFSIPLAMCLPVCYESSLDDYTSRMNAESERLTRFNASMQEGSNLIALLVSIPTRIGEMFHFKPKYTWYGGRTIAISCIMVILISTMVSLWDLRKNIRLVRSFR
jgi:hypothetical protein